MRYIIAALFISLFSTFAFAQTPMITKPYGVTSNNQSSTITTTNTFQQIFPASTGNTGRSSCTIINRGTHAMEVFFGPIASASLGVNTVPLAVGDKVYCSIGNIVLKDQVSITGTIGDAFFAAQQ